MGIELKPCPFCGEKPEFVCQSYGQGGRASQRFNRTYKLLCQYCGCTQGSGITVYLDYSPLMGTSIDDSELKKAADLWNKRAGDDQQILSLNELHQMDNEPVWIEDENGSGWELSADAADYFEGREVESYGKKWKAYRHKPKEVQK